MRMNLPVTDIERQVPKSAVLVSKTDLDGVINYCNKTLCEISGYTENELLGAPHNLIRHPDVPVAVFAECWQTIRAGRPWNGVIKNRCKSGDYYWVEANISPWIESGVVTGYISLRYKATRAQIVAAEAAYESPALLGENAGLDYVVELQRRLADKVMELEKYRDRSEEELQIGSDIMLRINGMNGMTDPAVRQKISPAAYYSGDMILATRTPADVLHVLLADAVGHGLTAAINVLPLSQTFFSMSKKGFDISKIAGELNQKIHKFMPVDRFVAATLISIDERNKVVEVWNGGNPAPVLVGDSGILKKWPSRNLPLGIFGRQDFSGETERYCYDQSCQLYLFSDGLPEAESPIGMPFGREQIDSILQTAPPEHRFDALISAFEAHLYGRQAHDDVSLAMVQISDPHLYQTPPGKLPVPQLDDFERSWRMTLSLGANELRSVDVVPVITELVAKVQGSCNHRSTLFLIVSELFNNALDHGILRLDSRLKQGVEGFEAYLTLRAERLSRLYQGSIDIEIGKVYIDGQQGVKISVSDSGDGFDYLDLAPGGAGHLQYGRGLALVQELAYKLEFAQQGREVVAYCVCPDCNRS